MLSQEIMKYGDKKSRFYVNDQETAMLVRCAFGHFVGEIEQSPYLRIALNLGGGGTIKEYRNGKETIREWRKGSIYLGLGEPCQIDCPAVEILSIAINLEAWQNIGLCNYTRRDFSHVVSHPPTDSFVATMLKALWESAAIYGLETELFKVGTLQILEHLANKQVEQSHKPFNKGLPQAALSVVDNLIERKMEQRITIAEMAASINMEEARFARAFAVTKGQTPFTYLTSQRILKAQYLLKKGCDITSTATTVGYSNPSKFAAAFRRYTGKSPSEWKRSELNKCN